MTLNTISHSVTEFESLYYFLSFTWLETSEIGAPLMLAATQASANVSIALWKSIAIAQTMQIWVTNAGRALIMLVRFHYVNNVTLCLVSERANTTSTTVLAILNCLNTEPERWTAERNESRIRVRVAGATGIEKETTTVVVTDSTGICTTPISFGVAGL